MNRVLKQEATHEGGDCQELAIDEHAEGEANNRHARCVGLKCSFDVPLVIEFGQPSLNGLGTLLCASADSPFGLLADAIVYGRVCMFGNSGDRGRDHEGLQLAGLRFGNRAAEAARLDPCSTPNPRRVP